MRRISQKTRVKYMSHEQAGLPSARGPGPFELTEGPPMRSDYALKRFLWLKSKMPEKRNPEVRSMCEISRTELHT